MRLRRIEPIVRRAFRGPCRIPGPGTILVGVSGGADSTSLLIALHRLQPEFGWKLHAAHLHHGTREAEAEDDLKFVHDLCSALGVPLACERWNGPLRMRRRGVSGEQGLRVLRREFLSDRADRIGAVAIATAHTADDQLETILMRLARGTGLRGLGGMNPRHGRWIKPLLEATRQEIEADLRAAHQTWREDSSNRDLGYFRNRVRHLLVPAFVSTLEPTPDPADTRAALARRVALAAHEARQARRVLESTASRFSRRWCRIQANHCVIDRRAMHRLAPALRRVIFERAWNIMRGPDSGLTSTHFDALHRLVSRGRGGARVQLPGGWEAEVDCGFLHIRPLRPGSSEGAFQLNVPGEVSWRGRMIHGSWTSGAVALENLCEKSCLEEYFAAEGLEGALMLRTARADESFVPFGKRRPVRIGPFLRKQAVSREVRSRPTVLADSGGVLWVIGVRRAARALVTSVTRKVLRVHAESHD